MATHPLQDFLRRLRRARSVREGGHLTDAQLLDRFAVQRDEAAFEVLVWRHGPLVLNLARRLLCQAADAEDVFQATFLTLARKASAIRRRTALGSWLYKVAYRLALRLRRAEARREPGQRTDLDRLAAPVQPSDTEAAAILAEEVNRLPERCRAVVVLCYLQGATTEEAARVLGCPRGTVLSRLASARQRLRQRLLRRGLAPALALAAVSFGETALASPSAALVAGVVGAALPFAAGRAALPMVSTQAATLAQGALQTMLWNKIKFVGAMACVLALAGSGVGWMAGGRSETETAPPVAAPPLKKETARRAAPEREEETDRDKARIQALLNVLSERNHAEEEESDRVLIDARLVLLGLQDKLRQQEREWDAEREEEQQRLKALTQELLVLKARIDEFNEKTGGGGKAVQQLIEKANNRQRNIEIERRKIHNSEAERTNKLYEFRKKMLHAESRVHCLEARQSEHREEYAAKREGLLTRLQQLENKSLPLEPADRLREVERKLDALRREIGELRRTLERPKSR